ncbi:MAG TPA: hypothetical protein VGE96_00545 [Steroidobacteraceae bacterium]|jgi:hypothetical protein
MNREAERHLANRIQLLEMEASLQRAQLAVTLAKWEKRRALAWGGTLARWGWRVLSAPRWRWMLATQLLTRLKRRRSR